MQKITGKSVFPVIQNLVFLYYSRAPIVLIDTEVKHKIYKIIDQLLITSKAETRPDAYQTWRLQVTAEVKILRKITRDSSSDMRLNKKQCGQVKTQCGQNK